MTDMIDRGLKRLKVANDFKGCLIISGRQIKEKLKLEERSRLKHDQETAAAMAAVVAAAMAAACLPLCVFVCVRIKHNSIDTQTVLPQSHTKDLRSVHWSFCLHSIKIRSSSSSSSKVQFVFVFFLASKSEGLVPQSAPILDRDQNIPNFHGDRCPFP